MPFALYAQQKENCILKEDADAIYVYLCDSELSDFKEIFVEFEVEATLAQYTEAVLNVSEYSTWQYKCTNQKIVKQNSQTDFYYYAEIETPWPVDNRDVIFHLKLYQDPKTQIISQTLEEIPNFIDHYDGIVRIPKAFSTLTLIPIDEQKLKVNYHLTVDPGGEIPAFIANAFAAKAPWQTFSNIRKRFVSQGQRKKELDLVDNYKMVRE
ncbi:MAG: hypothetical protein JXQ90_23610 [Cyclobacteriaceae bacterium]